MEVSYGRLERLLHRVAFASPHVQRAAADIEDTLFKRRLAAFGDAPPIFITALPRAGTTLLLEALNEFDEVATHTYRDMPFVMAPMLWAQLAGAFRKKATLKERAHADGMLIGYDSPEAFEEVLWRAFWPAKYHADRIDLWQAADLDEEAATFFRTHFKKVVALRAGAAPGARYASKNNGNIARLDLLPRLFPDADIVVLVRDPVEHAWSLWRQHQRFTAMQADEPFVATYMGDIGHYEFGRLHRPFAFARNGASGDDTGPDAPAYWLRYWIAAYEHLAASASSVLVLPYDRLCAQPATELARLATALELPHGAGLARAVARIGDVPPARADAAAFDRALVQRARDIQAELLASTA